MCVRVCVSVCACVYVYVCERERERERESEGQRETTDRGNNPESSYLHLLDSQIVFFPFRKCSSYSRSLLLLLSLLVFLLRILDISEWICTILIWFFIFYTWKYFLIKKWQMYFLKFGLKNYKKINIFLK